MDEAKEKNIPTRRPILSFSFGQLGQRYVDYKIQMRLLLALLAMELTIVAAGLFYLYFRFRAIIDENIYRVHKHPTSDVFATMLNETTWVIVVSVVVNLAALLLADRIWIRYVRTIIISFGSLADRMADLNFENNHADVQASHESLDMMQAWHQGERQRALSIHAVIQSINLDTLNDPGSTEHIRQQLRTIHELLPPYSRRYVGKIR